MMSSLQIILGRRQQLLLVLQEKGAVERGLLKMKPNVRVLRQRLWRTA